MSNRLAHEKSPYLLQHANNPVDWHPWGDEAFTKAKAESKPIFLSIGYATCHWCHVMERESFENAAVARILNENFVSIKVDREERPDVDRVYMLFVQASTGQGGWPMSVWLTPDRKPFFGGTYFPPDARFGRPGFAAILQSLAEAWKTDRKRVEDSGAKVLEQLGDYTRFDTRGQLPGAEALEKAYEIFRRAYDPKYGGFGRAPKFPRPSVFNFLLRYYRSTGNEEALEMVTETLRAMTKGGMHDQIGGGFHRYSVDERWFVPHFEKMLYDQAQLAISYVEAFQITRDGEFAATARDIFTYVLRDLTDPAGGFYCAEDADSAQDASDPHDKSEGAFYIWSKEELNTIFFKTSGLGDSVAAMFAYRYGVDDNGNVSEDPQGEFVGRNILYEAHTIEQTATHAGVSVDDARAALVQASRTLLAARAKRPRPLLDDKILASWNGLMISAFAKGAQILNEPKYAAAARSTADFLKHNLWDGSRRILRRRYRQGESAVDGFLDDYAFCGLGLLDLYETTFSADDLNWAIELAQRALALFEDKDHGGFFATPLSSAPAVPADAAPELVLRLKDDYDGAEPSGNSTMALFLTRLARMTGRDDFRIAAERTLKAFASRIEEGAVGVPQMLVALQLTQSPPSEIVLAGPLDQAQLAAIHRHFLPQAIVMRAEHIPDRDLPAIDGKPTAYVCENFACKLPVTTAEELETQLK